MIKPKQRINSKTSIKLDFLKLFLFITVLIHYSFTFYKSKNNEEYKNTEVNIICDTIPISITQDEIKLICPELSVTRGIENLNSGRTLAIKQAKLSHIDNGLINVFYEKENELRHLNIYEFKDGRIIGEGTSKISKIYNYDDYGNLIKDSRDYHTDKLIEDKQTSGLINYFYDSNCIDEKSKEISNRYCFNQNGKAIQWTIKSSLQNQQSTKDEIFLYMG